MARMYPEQLLDFVESSAERLLYKLFEVQLPDSFIVMHGVKWLMRNRRHHDQDGEIDFLIVHRELGLLILEVKGGRIRVESSTTSAREKRDRSLSWGKHDRWTQIRGVWGKSWVPN